VYPIWIHSSLGLLFILQDVGGAASASRGGGQRDGRGAHLALGEDYDM